MESWTNFNKLSIFAVWTLLASNSCTFTCDARSTTAMYMSESSNPINNAAVNQPPLCVYPPPPMTVQPLPTMLPPPTTVQPLPTMLPPPTRTPSSSPPYTKPDHGAWCVGKPTVPASEMQHALDYACASGADCGPVQASGACYQPDTVLAHASYAFNSYWQKTKKNGGTCDFGGSAMLVNVDPSYDQCRFIYG